MRIDTDAPAGGLELDPRARLRHYAGAFKRRWWMVLLPCVLGATLGWFTAPAPPSGPKGVTPTTVPSESYYRATHVLIRESDSGSGSSSNMSISLSQAAYLVNTGQVPVNVAEKLSLPVEWVESHVLGLPRDQVSSIEVRAVGEDPTQVVALSDTAADELIAQLKAQAEAAQASRRDGIVAQLDTLDKQLKDLNVRIAFNPPDRTQLEAQQRSLSNQYSLVFQQFAELANTPPPTAGLISLEGAKAKPISKSDYLQDLRTIREGASYVTGSSPVTTAPPTNDDVIQAADSQPVGPGTRAQLGGGVGLALGVGLVLLLDRFDARLRRREEVELASGLTVVAEIPKLSRKAHRSTEIQALSNPRSRAAEAYRVVRGAIIYSLSQRAPRGIPHGTPNAAAVLMVTSANPGEGKTLTVANLAAVFAEGGLNVLVVNCDFRRPRIHRYLIGDTPAAPEVPDVLAPRDTLIPRVQLVTGIGEGVSDANPIEVVALQQQVIDAQRGNYHVILLDTAPFLATNDASELLPRTDLVTVVVRSGKTTAQSANRLAEVLARFDAPMLGVVFNGSEETQGAQYYYYGYSEPSRETSPSVPTPPAPPPAPAHDAGSDVRPNEYPATNGSASIPRNGSASTPANGSPPVETSGIASPADQAQHRSN